MKIIIAGAGDIGFHLAELLVYEDKDIVLIDTNQDVLDYAATHLDVMTLRGDSSSIDILNQAQVDGASLVLAVTTSEKNNLVTAILAKKMGARQTIARVNNYEYLTPPQRSFFKELGIDSLISPQELAAEEILRLVNQCSFTDIFEFENGKINLLGISLDENSPVVNKCLAEVDWKNEGMEPKAIAILRGHRTIIPRGDTLLRRGDHVYFMTKKENIDPLVNMVGKKKVKVRNVMILGGTDLGFASAKRLENEYHVTLIEPNKDRCKYLAERLKSTLIINGEPGNIELLEEEGLSNMDASIALTTNSETNIIASLTAKNHGVFKTIAQVENKEYIHISQNIGVDTLINKKLIAANNIFRFIRKGQIEAITSLHGVDAEIIEYVVHKNNQLTKKPNGDFQLQVDYKVIVFALPEAIGRLEKLFR